MTFTMVIGSSPRLWGTLAERMRDYRKRRFIPTAVGNACFDDALHSVHAVHPHGCGERRMALIDINRKYGSSPRLWGTRRHRRPRLKVGRFIPTAVGNAPTNPASTPSSTVHPHGCGERVNKLIIADCVIGSSPRLWGTRKFCLPTMEPLPVHPHGCGERKLRKLPDDNRAGSSPRLWGTRGGCAGEGARCRFIPTAVGNAIDHSRPGQPIPVHPHGCGEREPAQQFHCIGGGSSPRLWGTQQVTMRLPAYLRFIPTAVGNA